MVFSPEFLLPIFFLFNFTKFNVFFCWFILLSQKRWLIRSLQLSFPLHHRQDLGATLWLNLSGAHCGHRALLVTPEWFHCSPGLTSLGPEARCCSSSPHSSSRPPPCRLSLHLWMHQAGRPLAPRPLPPSSTVLSASGTCVGIRWGHPLWPPVSLLHDPPVSASIHLLPLSLIPSGMTNLTGLFRLPRLYVNELDWVIFCALMEVETQKGLVEFVFIENNLIHK